MNDERLQFLEWKNEKAILLQKIQIQEMYIQEAREREENLRKMNETFINTLNMPQNDNVVQKFQKTFEQNQIEQQQEIISNLQIEVKMLEDKLIDKENQIKQIIKNNEKEILKLQNKILDLDQQQSDKENINNNLNELQQKLNQQQMKYQQEIEKQKVNFETQLRKLKVTNFQKENDDLLKLKEENKKLKSQIKSQETSLKVSKQKNLDQEILEAKVSELENSNIQFKKSYQDQQQRIQNLINVQDNLKNQIVQLNAQLEEEKVFQSRQRNQSPSHPTTRIRTTQQLQQITNNKFDDSTYQDSADISNFLSKINPNLEGQIRDIQSKLYNAKKKLTTTTEQENSFIRQSIQKIKNRSRNHSISVNETAYVEERSNWDDQVEYKTNQTNQSLMCNGFRFC